MIKQDFYIANLIARYLSEEITPEETIKLTAWREESTAHEILFKKICDEENQKQHFRKNTAFNPSSGWKEVEKRIKRNNNRSRYIKIVSYAAIILLPVLFVSISMKFTSPVSLSDKQFIAQSILPGESQAILTLEDGQTIHINKETESLLEKIDGARVHMDSTMLNYQFDNGPRKVELEGEAYFEVCKTGQPFIVCTQGMQVEVLGTTFNISAYPQEEYQTTLVNGSVKVNTETGESCILKPSQQATISLGNSSIQIRMVDAGFYTSWIKGKIHFKDQRLEDIMKILSRWYDMEVIFANEKIKDLRFGCNVDRYSEITPFVRLLEETQKVHVKVNNKTITFYN